MELLDVIRFEQTRRQRWRNGGGWTREIALAGDLADFDWRLSLAEVERDGPFSLFPGIEREIVLLSGAGMVLDFADGECAGLTPEIPRLRFAGERALHSRLLDGPTTDFNLMWARQRIDAELWRRPLAGATTVWAEPGETWAVHLVEGEAWLPDAGDLRLARGDTVLLSGGARRRRQCMEANGHALVIRLRRLPA
ncbi:HutD family protein [Lysobacter pythonis]|uniref:HutD family protein n=1 Tax=Solilutibacter pythonis TaxID=2483112 RepID=A0A3M2I144_9GAMM|nr:HutD family protein [Lysobacter pythonis]RMH94095.1 HutD family protein [Lysobacter pythonis]